MGGDRQPHRRPEARQRSRKLAGAGASGDRLGECPLSVVTISISGVNVSSVSQRNAVRARDFARIASMPASSKSGSEPESGASDRTCVVPSWSRAAPGAWERGHQSRRTSLHGRSRTSRPFPVLFRDVGDSNTARRLRLARRKATYTSTRTRRPPLSRTSNGEPRRSSARDPRESSRRALARSPSAAPCRGAAPMCRPRKAKRPARRRSARLHRARRRRASNKRARLRDRLPEALGGSGARIDPSENDPASRSTFPRPS